MGHRQDPQLVCVHFVDQIERKATQAKTAGSDAERPTRKRKGDEERFCMLDFVQELAAQAVGLVMIE